MPQKLYIPSCVHQPGHRTGARCCQSCGAQHQFDRWGLTMHEQMAVYQYVYGLKPIGPHGPLADELLASKRQPCRLCEGAGIITLHRGDSWGLCATCEGTGGHWTCRFEEVGALRRLVLQQFPDARVDATPHSFVSPRLVHDLGAGMIVDLLQEPDDAEGVLEREDEFDDECERITQQGELVFSLEWDSGGAGAGGGDEGTHRLNGPVAGESF